MESDGCSFIRHGEEEGVRILVADDDALTLESLVERLRRGGHDVTACEDGDDAWRRATAEDGDHDMMILDWMMPGIDGLELCRRIRRRTDRPYVYLIVMTVKGSPEDVVAGLDAGADDYLVKPFSWEELDARVRAGGRIVDLQNRLILAQDALRVQAMQDPLTRIMNHGAIMDSLLKEVARAHRESTPLSIILGDLDDFKRINDEYGHVVGDHVLVEVAKRMRSCLRPYDSVGRYGGEEFLTVLPSTEPEAALALAERIRSTISSDAIRVDGTDVSVTISQGVTVWADPHPIPGERLIQAADRALYAVKHAGRNGVNLVHFDPREYDGAAFTARKVEPAG
jgi:two-component system, cell cycle response regulator